MRQGIGTLSEKTVHAVMKNYYAPDTDMHEICLLYTSPSPRD